jgi:tyrosine-protein kinase Etk/Wzc
MSLLNKRDELATRFTSAHPGMVAVERQISAVRQQQQDFEQTVRRLPALQQRAAELKLDMRVATDLYTVLLGSTQQLQLMKAGRVASARIVDVAVTAKEPVRRNRSAVMLVFLFGGLATSIGFVVLAGWLSGAVSEPDEIERALCVGVLGTLPLLKTQRKLDESGRGRPMALTAPSDPVIECIRSLRTALVLSNPNPEKNVLLVTAAEPGAGKSFLAANLAVVLAGAGQRVLLVDADTRRGYLHESFGMSQAPGLSDPLAGTAQFDGIVHADVAPGVDLIARGSTLPDIHDPFTGAGLEPVLDAYRSRYAWVIVDTPPVLATADTTMLARHANVLLLVARSGQSRLSDLKESCKRLRLCGLTPTGVILNGVVPRLGRYGTSYGMAYSSYYGNSGK